MLYASFILHPIKDLTIQAMVIVMLYQLWVYYEPTTWPAPSLLDNSVSRAPHRYRRCHGFESRFVFQALISQLLKLCISLMSSHQLWFIRQAIDLNSPCEYRGKQFDQRVSLFLPVVSKTRNNRGSCGLIQHLNELNMFLMHRYLKRLDFGGKKLKYISTE